MSDLSDRVRSNAGARGNASAGLMALAIMALGAFVSYDSMTGLTGPGYAQVGPGVFPVIVGIGLLLAGIGLLTQAVRGQWRVTWIDNTPSALSRESHPIHGGDRMSIALIAAALTLNVVLFAPLGFVAASALLFVCVSAAFGSKHFVLSTAIGIAFAAAIYLVFVHGLGLQLPAGDVWKGLLWTR